MCFHQFERRGSALLKKALTLAQNQRVDKEPVAIHKTMLNQRLHKRGAAVDHNVPTVLLLELADYFHDILFDQR